MKLVTSFLVLFLALFYVAHRPVDAAELAVIQFEDNGCDDNDLPQMEQIITDLIQANVDPNAEIVYEPTIGTDDNDNGRRDQVNPCQSATFCKTYPLMCILIGCSTRRRRLAVDTRTLSTAIDPGMISILGTQALRSMPTENPNCRPSELLFTFEL